MKAKKFLAGLMTAVMVLTSLPMTVFAADGSGEGAADSVTIEVGTADELTTAMSITTADEFEIVLTKDIALTDGLVVGKENVLTLDLAGYTISCGSDKAAGNAAITNKGDLTIKDSGNDGKITYNSTAPSTANAYGTHTISNEGGTLTLLDGIIENTTTAGASYGIDNNSTLGKTILNVEGGKIVAEKVAIRQFANSATAVNKVSINDGTITGSRAMWIQLPGSDNGSSPKVDVDITGGTLTAAGESGGYKLAIYSYSYGNSYDGVDINIEKGAFDGDIAVGGGSSKGGSGAEKVRISGGSFGKVYSYMDDDRADIAISGGIFASAPTAYAAENYIVRVDSAEKYTVIPTGEVEEGTYTTAPASVPEGCIVVENEDGTFTVERAYEINEDKEVVVYTGTKDADDAETVTVDVKDVAEALAAVTSADAVYNTLVLDATDENKDITKITLTSDLITALSEAANENLILCLATYRYDGEVLLDKAFITALKAAAGNHDITMTLADVVNSNAISSPYGFNAYNVVFEANGKVITFPAAGRIVLNAAYVLDGYTMDQLMIGTPNGKVAADEWSVIYEDEEETVVWVSMDMTAWGDYYLTEAGAESGTEFTVYAEPALSADGKTAAATVDAEDITEVLAAVSPADVGYKVLVLDATVYDGNGESINVDSTEITLTSDLIAALSSAENNELVLCIANRHDGDVWVSKDFIAALKATVGENSDITMTLADTTNANAVSNAISVVFEANGAKIKFPADGWINLETGYWLNGYTMDQLMVGTPTGKVSVGTEGDDWDYEEDTNEIVWISMDVTAWGDYYLTKTSSSSGGSSGGGGGSSSSTTGTTNKNEDGSITTTITDNKTGTVTEKTENADGSTVTVETKKDGTVTEIKENVDGSKETLETKADGTVTATVENTDGSKASVETKTDGTVTTTVERADGVTAQTVETAGGNITAEVSVPANVEQTVVTIPVATAVTPGLVAMDAVTGEIITMSVPTEGGVNIVLSESANIVLVDNSKDFADTTGHWGSDAVDFVSARGIMGGVGGQSFDPDSDLTRGQIATILRNIETDPAAAAEAPAFNDVAEGHWAAESVAWAAENGFVSGYADGTYGVNDSITREQLASILYRYAGSPAVSGSLAGFADDSSVSAYAQDAMIWATQQGLISGVGENTLAPQGNATRVQVASIIMRYINTLAK